MDFRPKACPLDAASNFLKEMSEDLTLPDQIRLQQRALCVKNSLSLQIDFSLSFFNLTSTNLAFVRSQ